MKSIKNQDSQTKITAIKAWLGTGSINVFGMPFAGKDTQCDRLATLLSAASFGGGDILRNSTVTQELKTAIDGGSLAPTEEYRAIVLPYFNRPEFVGKPLVLSSVGRWIGEEEAVLEAAKKSGHPIMAVIVLSLSEAHAVERLEMADRGRDDDHMEKLHTRFNEFETKTQPVLEVYAAKHLLVSVSGEQSMDEVTEAIITNLYSFIQETAQA